MRLAHRWNFSGQMQTEASTKLIYYLRLAFSHYSGLFDKNSLTVILQYLVTVFYTPKMSELIRPFYAENFTPEKNISPLTAMESHIPVLKNFIFLFCRD